MPLRFRSFASGLVDGIDYRVEIYDTGNATFKGVNGYTIDNVDTGADEFIVSGDATDDLTGGDTFYVSGRTGSLETWTASSVTPSATQTTITVNGDITDGTVSGSVYPILDFTADEQWVVWNVSEGDDVGLKPIRPHEFTLSMVEDNGDLSVLRGTSEDNTRIEIYRTDTSTKIYQGFVAPNNVRRIPLGPSPDFVRLNGTEGIPLLKKKKVDTLSWSSNSTVTYMKAIRTIINQLYATSLPIEASTRWYPAGGSLTSSDLSLQNRDIKTNNLRGNRPKGDWFTLLEALKSLLRPFNLTIQQTRRLGGVAWWIAPWDAYKSNGEIHTWKIQPNGSTTDRGDQDVVIDLDSNHQEQLEADSAQPEEGGERRRQSVAVTYDHPEVSNFLRESGFEPDPLKVWAVDDSDLTNAGTTKHSNVPESPDPTTDNQRLAIMTYDEDSGNGNEVYGFQQSRLFVRPKSETFFRLTFDNWVETLFERLVRVNVGGTYWTNRTVTIRSGTLPGDVELPIDPLTAPIAEGASLSIRDSGNNHKATLDVQERAATGDEKITGKLDAKVEKGWTFDHITPTGSQDRFSLGILHDTNTRETWTTESFYLPCQDSNGNRLSDTTVIIELGVKKTDYNNISGGLQDWYFDNVRLQPVKGGQVLNETRSTASIDEVGKEEEIDVRFGSGPSRNAVSRIVNGLQWGIGPNPTSPDIYPLSELHARQRLRYFRGTNDQFSATVLVDGKTPQITGHEIVKLNGNLHRVMAVESQPSEGRLELSLLEHNDYGT